MMVQLVTTTNTAAMIAMFPKFFLNEKYDFWSTDYLNRRRNKNINLEPDEDLKVDKEK